MQGGLSLDIREEAAIAIQDLDAGDPFERFKLQLTKDMLSGFYPFEALVNSEVPTKYRTFHRSTAYID